MGVGGWMGVVITKLIINSVQLNLPTDTRLGIILNSMESVQLKLSSDNYSINLFLETRCNNFELITLYSLLESPKTQV